MAESVETTDLSIWERDGAFSPDALHRLKVDPRFPDAARALAANMLAAAAADRALDGIFKDAGRYLVALLAISMHVSGGGLTLPRLKAMGAATGFLSPGRARAVLIYLRYLGYVELFPARRRGEPARYLPTRRFQVAWRAHMRAALRAACLIESSAELVLERLERTDVFDAFARHQCQGIMESARGADQHMDFVRIFLQRHAGIQIAWTLIGAGREGEFPPREPLQISLAAMARRFSVSRTHVRRLLDDAERSGLFRGNDDGTIVFEPAGRAQIELVYATQLVLLLAAAAKTLREMPELMSGRTPSGVARPAVWDRQETPCPEARPS